MHLEPSDSISTSAYESDASRLWELADSRPNSSATAPRFAELIRTICGTGPVLDAGCGTGALVRALIRTGMDARGVDIAEAAVAVAGPALAGRLSRADILDLPFADGSFETVVAERSIEFLDEADVSRALSELARVSQRFVILRVATEQAAPGPWRRTAAGRAFWEGKCFEAGLRKHPQFYDVNAYESLNHDGAEILIPLEKIPAVANARYPLRALREERDLHMDMLREHGSRSDAHVGRYQFAARYVRPGDVVLDAACGLGYGSYVVRKSTQCGPVTGIDGSAYGVDYATSNFGIAGETSYIEGYLPDCLKDIPSHSVDVVLSFETLEHVEAPEALLREFHRILTPGGRLVASVPHDWSDESGDDPNPYHLHVYDRSKFVAQLTAEFDIEGLFSQTADRVKNPSGHCEWLARPRSLFEIDAEARNEPVEAEWLLAVASKSPLNGASVPFEERVFTAGEREASGHALAFRRDYENPWLIRSIISIGLRTENARLRQKWARGVLAQSSPFSADRGAALCILAYQELTRDAGSARNALVEAIDDYIGAEPVNPNALRWQISLRFARALMELASGQRKGAERFLQQVIDAPAAQYSPTLLTKTAEAALLQGSLRAGDDDIEGARAIWQSSYRAILSAVAECLREPYRAEPPKFELREIGNVLTLAGRLATASAYAPELKTRPAAFQQRTGDDAALHIANLEKGKAWLESAWRASVAENDEKQAYLLQLVEGKDWLEGKWRSGQDTIAALEAQLQAQHDEMARRSSELEASHARAMQAMRNELVEATERLSAQVRDAQLRAERLEASLPVRIARKFGRHGTE